MRLSMVLFSILLFASSVYGGEKDDDSKSTVIPLDTVWALEMPDTRDIRELDSDRNYVNKIVRSLGDSRDKLGPGFAVVGNDREALKLASAILAGESKSHGTVRASDEVVIAFFSAPLGSFVHLDKVEMHGQKLKVYYQFVPHRTRQMTSHFALIPLGRPPVGQYSVEYIQAPIEEEYQAWGLKPLNPEWANRVCKSFTFDVVGQNPRNGRVDRR